MDTRTTIRNVVIALIGVGLLIIFVVLLWKAIFGHHAAPTSQVNVGKYAYTSAEASLLIDGPTNLDQDHRQVKITVSATENRIDIIQGYQGNVIKSQTYSNNSAAYAAFLQSLQLLNFSKGTKSTADYRGYCPAGTRYLYSFNDGQSDLFTYWSTSCGSQGTFQGNPSAVRQLFIAQIPQNDFGTLTSGVNVGL